jgi:Bacterial Ig domain
LHAAPVHDSISHRGGSDPDQRSANRVDNGADKWAVFAAPWTGVIKATAADSEGTVTQLQFMAGVTVLGRLINPPANASFTVTNLAAGSYTLKAVATDNGGASTTSSGISITAVAPAPISLNSVKQSSTTSFQLSYSTTPGLSYIVQRSADLFHWNPLATNSASGSQASFTDNAASEANTYLHQFRLERGRWQDPGKVLALIQHWT